MENNTCWMRQGTNYRQVPSNIQINNSLQKGIYSIEFNPHSGEFSLQLIADKFEFDFELLGLEQKFINHVLASYHNTTGNFGILMNGVKGCGKTVTAKVLANTLNLPVILVDTAYPGLDNFLASLNFQCILFFDEYEKCFKVGDEYHAGNDHNILTIMDGVFNCSARKIFLLTTNEKKINSCLLSRPSRIRYVKEFTNISMEVINHLMDKFLEDQSIREELILYVTSLDVVSVDIIKAIIQEINIHGKDSFSYIKEIFNVQISPVQYDYLYCNMSPNYYPEPITLTPVTAKAKLKRYVNLKSKWSTRDASEEKEFSGYYENPDTDEEHWITGLNDYCHDRYGEFPTKFENLSVGDLTPVGVIFEIDREERMLTCRQGRDVYFCYIPEQKIYSRNAMAYGYYGIDD